MTDADLGERSRHKIEMPECPRCERELVPADFDGLPSEGAVCRYCTGEYYDE